MSTRALREELERIAAAAPVADVPAGTWARAQRARRRDRVATLAAVAAAVAVVAGLVTWLPGRSAPPVAAGAPTARAGVPAYVWSVPERLTMQRSDGSWSSDRVETDLAVGRGAVAYVTHLGLPVVVGAGERRLPPARPPRDPRRLAAGLRAGSGWRSPGRSAAGVRLGRQGHRDAAPMPSGVRVVDLETGDDPHDRLVGGEGVEVDTIGWSPDSRWLAWRGRVKRSWTASRGRRQQRGRAHRTGLRASEPVPAGRGEPVVSIADDGKVSVLGRRRANLGRSGARAAPARLPQVSRPRRRPVGARFAFGAPRGRRGPSVDVATGRLSPHRSSPGSTPRAPRAARSAGSTTAWSSAS